MTNQAKNLLQYACLTAGTLLISFIAFSQPSAATFELRQFTSDPKANGETDFKGETEWFDTPQRIDFLNRYADYASQFYGNPGLDKKIVTDEEIDDLIGKIKPQPGTSVRTTISLSDWRKYGYREGQASLKQQQLSGWARKPGARIEDGELVLEQTTLENAVNPMTWRFEFRTRIRIEEGGQVTLSLKDKEKNVISLLLENQGKQRTSAAKGNTVQLDPQKGSLLVIEGDFTQKRFNCYVDGRLVRDFAPVTDTSAEAVSSYAFTVSGRAALDDLFIFSHTPAEEVNYPYKSAVLADEDFSEKPDVSGWQTFRFDDSHWTQTALPAVHGGIREKEESLYLRTKVYAGSFERAFLQLETLDPGGEVWVNGQVVAVISNRHPHEIEVTRFLKPESENLIAIRVNPYKLRFPMPHTPTDPYIGWFLGRTRLQLTSACRIKHVEAFTQSLSEEAIQLHKVTLNNPGRDFVEGTLDINYYPWFPEEGALAASHSRKIKIRPSIDHEMEFEFAVPDPRPWSPGSPSLYKVEVILRDEDGHPLDDYVLTTGIRTVHQRDGNFYLNGRVEMLNGAQIMGFRTPIETTSKFNRCAPEETVAEEMLMIRKMDANLLRVHVHAEKDTIDGINDPRYAEYADQMGICLIWSTAAFIREGEAWNIDYEGYPKFMKQVINHPSIVMWEASNHPNRFKRHDISETHDFISRIYHTIHQADQSRLISPTSFWQHTHYGNYDGTRDYRGNPIQAVPEFMAELVTRGSQDAYTGYGADWSRLRNAPNSWAGSCLAANDKAYFNFEHEESIGQPNWELSKGKPWYRIHSYEWGYDEGSIGRRLTADEWRVSQAWQAFSAWESMKKQMLLGYDGFSWCCLRGGANMGTYQKPLIDNLRHPKLAWYANKMVFQRTWAGSNDVDVVYGPADRIVPVIHHLGDEKTVSLEVLLKDMRGRVIDRKRIPGIRLEGGRSVTVCEGFRFRAVKDGTYAVEYIINDN